MTYIALDTLKTHLGLESATLTKADSDRLWAALTAAIAQVEQAAGRGFAPRRITLFHAIDPYNLSELLLDDDLLTLTSLTNGDGTLIALTEVESIGAGVLRLKNGLVFVASTDAAQQPIQVAGVWGWHEAYATAWRPSGDQVVTLTTLDGISTLGVQDADGIDPTSNRTPRFMVGQLIQVNTEFFSIVAVNTSTNLLTVRRGQRGTSFETSPVGQSISIYTPSARVELLIVRWAAWLYKAPEKQMGAGIPTALLEEARALRRVRVKS
ncbi:MAG: hypothetical protein H7Y11_09090 [Armatimonadetes bacterium]|nr:hypothetical protein [Anaerolineae bacterium]